MFKIHTQPRSSSSNEVVRHGTEDMMAFSDKLHEVWKIILGKEGNNSPVQTSKIVTTIHSVHR